MNWLFWLSVVVILAVAGFFWWQTFAEEPWPLLLEFVGGNQLVILAPAIGFTVLGAIVVYLGVGPK